MSKNYIHRLAAMDNLKSRLSSNSNHVGRLSAIMFQLRSKVEALGNLHANPSPTQTEAANFKRTATAAKKLASDVKAARDQINTIMREGAQDIQRRMDAKVRLVPDEKYGDELRQVFRGLNAGDQAKMLNDLAIANEGPLLAAIVAVPAILTGVNAEMAGRYREQILSIHAREELAEQKELVESFDPVWAASRVAAEMADDFSDPSRMASIERGEAAAAAAEAAFNNAA